MIREVWLTQDGEFRIYKAKSAFPGMLMGDAMRIWSQHIARKMSIEMLYGYEYLGEL